MLKINVLPLGELQANCIILYCDESRESVVFDVGGESKRVEDFLKKNELTLKAIICTHGHADHIDGIGGVKKKFPGAQIMIHELDASMLVDPSQNLSVFFGPAVYSPPADKLIAEGDILTVGKFEIEPFHVPGHSPGSLVFYCCLQNGMAHPLLIAGDVIFNMSIGRTDFPNGSFKSLITGIKNKILTLPDDTEIYCGHGPKTRVGFERENNPFLQNE